jgi:hypothetical protein
VSWIIFSTCSDTGGKFAVSVVDTVFYILYLDENLMAMMGRLKTEFHRSARATKVGQN